MSNSKTEQAGQLRPTYNTKKSYDENYENGPFFEPEQLKAFPNEAYKGRQRHRLLDFELNSPVGIPAGLLLNSNWVSLYARLGFDLLTYKTVRSCYKESHPLPNCLFLKNTDIIPPDRVPGQLITGGTPPCDPALISITNSFGMPSKSPQIWQEDVERSKKSLGIGQILLVSVVSSQPESPDKTTEDFCTAAIMAKEAGADIVELNLSCPNVISGAGSIFKDADLTAMITKKASRAISPVPLFIKTGCYEQDRQLENILKVTAGSIQGIVGINSLQVQVVNESGQPALGQDRQKSGICGAVIKQIGLHFTRTAARISKKQRYGTEVIGVGGIMTQEGFQDYLDGGASAVMSCTGALFDPFLAVKWKTAKADPARR